jgi:two-component system phosphate regulon sensor histidine kinase PhoR
VQGKKIEAVALVKVVGEILLNQRPKLDPVRGIRFEFDADYIYRHCPADFHGDLELLYQAITNLVDNAVKYTYKNTVITVRAGKTKSERFFLSVRNKGLPISSKEAIDFKKRNSRGDLARLVTGEGNGLGLFIADKIMHAHGGELYILATDTSGFNEFRLIFPL